MARTYQSTGYGWPKGWRLSVTGQDGEAPLVVRAAFSRTANLTLTGPCARV